MRSALILLALLLSCSSPYIKNRERDALDVFTFEVQTKSYGASVRTGPVKFGLSYKSPQGFDGGLRGGDVGRHASAEFTAIAMGPDYFQKLPFKDLGNEIVKAEQTGPVESQNSQEKTADTSTDKAQIQKVEGADKAQAQKDEITDQDDPSESASAKDAALMHLRDKEYRVRSPFGTTVPLQKRRLVLKQRGSFAPASYYTQVDFNIALYFGLRVGLNPGELIDLILGWTTLDIFKDDEPFESDQEKKLKENPLYNSLTEEQKQKLREQLGK
ncbi:MAG: hypothetical protein K8S54_04600 [Spirochaetia bacterium]|nr:hypothetical protein [Spirochaetia bacterium]